MLRKRWRPFLLPPASARGGGAFADANGSTYVLTSFDGTNLVGLNDQGRTFDAYYGPATRFRLAALDKYIPGDPCRELAGNYNTYYGINDAVGFNATLTSMVQYSCKVKALVDQVGTLRSFQPVP